MKNKPSKLFFYAFGLIIVGCLMGYFAHTAGNKIEIQDLRFNAADGSTISALLYIPPNASVETPAPGVLAVHGYINSRETQSGFSIELARRGFVVLAMDQSGHGYSDPPAFANGFGAIAGLKYLRGLEFVDRERIGLEGHSMGGWAVRTAARVMPDAYKAVVLEGSSTSRLPGLGDFSASPTEPRNTAVVFSRYDEFGPMMWGTLARDVNESEALQQLFGTEQAVEAGRLYGSVEDNTARKLYQPGTTHPGDHISPEAILNAVDWLQLTLEHETDVEPDSHIFLWKEVGTLLALIGVVLLIFPLASTLPRLPLFQSAVHALPENRGDRGGAWWLSAGLSAAIPILTYFPFVSWGQGLSANAFWPQQITTGILMWALGNGLITVVLLAAAHAWAGRKQAAGYEQYGLRLSAKSLGTTALAAIAVVGLLGVVAAVVDWLFQLDFRFWVVALKPMSALHFRIFLCYLPFFVLFFLALSVAYNSRLRLPDDTSTARALGSKALIASLGFIVMLVIDYGSLFITGNLLFGEPLLTIVAIQFVALLIIIACVTTWCFQLTGRNYLGAFINGLFVTWYIVAGQATHYGL